MKNRRLLLVAGSSGIALAATLMAPAFGQERGGLSTVFTLGSGIETTVNPTLTPGGNETRTLVNTDLGVTLSSVTRQSEIELSASGRLRYSFDDVGTVDKGLSFGRQTLGLSYAHRAPRARLSATFRYLRDDLSFLDPVDLVNIDDGSIDLSDDFTDLRGTGTRESFTYRLRADFDQDGPFGWGASISGTELNYTDTTSPSLTDRSTFNAALNAHLNLTPTLRLNSRLGYSERSTDTTPTASTTTFGLNLTAVRSDAFSVRAGMTFDAPDTSDDRLAVTAGFTTAPSPQSELSLDLGAVFSDAFDTQLTGRLNYDVQLTRTSRFNAQFSTDVTDSTDNNVVINTAALVGLDVELTPVSSFSFDAVYAEKEQVATGSDTTEFSASAQINRRLNRDWQVSFGVSQTRRSETGVGSATSEAVFVNLGRSWVGRY